MNVLKPLRAPNFGPQHPFAEMKNVRSSAQLNMGDRTTAMRKVFWDFLPVHNPKIFENSDTGRQIKHLHHLNKKLVSNPDARSVVACVRC